MMASVDVSTVWIENESIVVPLAGLNLAFVGSIQFSGNYVTGQEQFVSMTYVNGYANTSLSASVSASVTSLPVRDLTGFLPGQQFQIYDGSSTELLTVSSTFTAASGAGNLTIASATAYAHAVNIAVSALPPSVKQAAIYVTAASLKARGNAALVMSSISPSTFQTANPSAAADFDQAMAILKPFRRIR
jgi:hypothetical protein